MVYIGCGVDFSLIHKMILITKMFPKKIKLSRFKISIIKCFFLATITTVLTNGLMNITGKLFGQDKIDNYANLLPSYLQENSQLFLSKDQFIIIGILWVFCYFLFSYLYNL